MMLASEDPAAGIDRFLCVCLVSTLPDWPFAADSAGVALFLQRCAWHGIEVLLHARLQACPAAAATWPLEIRQALRQAALAQAMWELRHRALLDQVLAALAGAGIVPVLFKGTALAYTLYPEAVQRTRSDTDLIIAPGMRAEAAAILAGLGFAAEAPLAEDGLAYEASFTRRESDGSSHSLDLHWRINNAELLSGLFDHAELLGSACTVPPLGPHARGADPVRALLIACMHRASHEHHPYYVNGVAHYGGDRLVWLYDIHLLSQAFGEREWDVVIALAQRKGLEAVCLDGLQRAGCWFPGSVPGHVLAGLAATGSGGALARYLAAGPLQQQWMDFLALGGFRRKLHFLWYTLFPPASRLRDKYPEGGWLPLLYCRRILSGLCRRLAGSRRP